ncbi:MAG: hypothetical protein JXL80_12760 [Planctomycetes bacterium]|nr:hypothetical protein [Planctomycetota bacterium]
MRRLIVLMMLLSCVSLSTGCMSRAIKEGVGAATGAKGVSFISSGFAGGELAAPLGTFTSFKVESFANQSPVSIPGTVNAMLPQYVAEELQKKKIPNLADGRTLTIRGTYIYYEDATKALDQAFGPFEEVIAKVQFLDGNKLVGEAICVGRSGETVNQGPDKKAHGLAKAIVGLIDKHYPKRED